MGDFVPRKLEEERSQEKGKTIGVWFNDAELEDLKAYGLYLAQEKPATIIKQMMSLGAKLIDDPNMRALRDLIYNNARKNKRLGIGEIDPRIRKS